VPLVPDQPQDVLINDVGLSVIAPDSTVWRPWVLDADLDGEDQAAREQPATRGINQADNLEQVLIPAASVTAGGTYTIHIQRDDVLETASQWVSIAVRGITPQPRPPLQLKTIEPGTGPDTWLLSWDTIVGRDYQIEFSTDLETWTDIGGLATAEVRDVGAAEGDVARLRRVRLAGRRHHVDRGDLVAGVHQVLDACAADFSTSPSDDDHGASLEQMCWR
jgi:hypothetical protein